MQITPDVGGQGLEPRGRVAGLEVALEGLGVGLVIDDVGDEVGGGGGEEDGEDGGGGEGGG